MKKYILVLSSVVLLFAHTLCRSAESAIEADVLKSTQSAVLQNVPKNDESAEVIIESKEPIKEDPDISGLQNAILQLNTKITSIGVSQTELENNLNTLDMELDKYKTRLSALDLKYDKLMKIKKMEVELRLLRSEVAQVRENMGVLKSENRRSGKKALRKWYRADWVLPASLGISVVALLIAL